MHCFLISARVGVRINVLVCKNVCKHKDGDTLNDTLPLPLPLPLPTPTPTPTPLPIPLDFEKILILFQFKFKFEIACSTLLAQLQHKPVDHLTNTICLEVSPRRATINHRPAHCNVVDAVPSSAWSLLPGAAAGQQLAPPRTGR